MEVEPRAAPGRDPPPQPRRASRLGPSPRALWASPRRPLAPRFAVLVECRSSREGGGCGARGEVLPNFFRWLTYRRVGVFPWAAVDQGHLRSSASFPRPTHATVAPSTRGHGRRACFSGAAEARSATPQRLPPTPRGRAGPSAPSSRPRRPSSPAAGAPPLYPALAQPRPERPDPSTHPDPSTSPDPTRPAPARVVGAAALFDRDPSPRSRGG